MSSITYSSPKLASKIYWLNKLASELPDTNLFLDYTRPFDSGAKDRNFSFKLSQKLSQKIISLAQGSYFTTYWVLLSVFNILLHQYTKDRELVIGIPAYKEIPHDDVTSPVIPLHTKVTPQATFKDFLLQVKAAIIEAYNHQNCDFEEIVKLSAISTGYNKSSIFNIIVLLQNIHDQSAIEHLNNDITVAFAIEDGVITGKIEYNQSLFNEQTIALLGKYYLNMLESVMQNLAIKISEITCLKKEDRHQLLQKFNQNQQQYPLEQTIERLFEQQVAQTPNKIAVVHQGNTLTYQQLNQQANQLARLLQKLGVKPGIFVGIYQQRDVHFLVAILAIYKAGGAYVPIDSTYPLDRIAYMLSNSEVRYLFTDCALLDSLQEILPNCQHLSSIICLDDLSFELQQKSDRLSIKVYQQSDFSHFSDHNLELAHDAVVPAYMLYTSGSTGLPKGAIVRHDGAINHIYAQFTQLQLGEEFTFLQSAPASTDISVWQFLAPLLIGGKTVIVDLETVAFAEKLFQVLKSTKVTVVELVPALFKVLLQYISQLSMQERELPDLRWMMLSGESISIKWINQWLEIYPQIKIANAYGPTEAADDITQFIVEQPAAENQRSIPIGKPLANLNLYILDEAMQLLPIGAPGEICVSGIGVGDGYWKNELKTKSSFVPNPFIDKLSQPNHEVIYKTGDLGRWLPDGNIEFLGRIDHQVKIRGFRIEIGEIETRLSQHSNVRENVVIARREETGVQLIAYVVAKKEPVPTVKQLQRFLKEKLPDQMIPAVFMTLTRLPIAPSGKIDRQALPAPERKISRQRAYVAPSNHNEATIVEIFASVLDITDVSIHDNFFELGGHSLLATQVISRLRQTFEIEFPLRILFEKPTVAQLAKYITTTNQVIEQIARSPIPETKGRKQIKL